MNYLNDLLAFALLLIPLIVPFTALLLLVIYFRRSFVDAQQASLWAHEEKGLLDLRLQKLEAESTEFMEQRNEAITEVARLGKEIVLLSDRLATAMANLRIADARGNNLEARLKDATKLSPKAPAKVALKKASNRPHRNRPTSE